MDVRRNAAPAECGAGFLRRLPGPHRPFGIDRSPLERPADSDHGLPRIVESHARRAVRTNHDTDQAPDAVERPRGESSRRVGVQVAAQDWPQFLGPARDGRYTGPPLAAGWAADGPPRLWSRPVGAGFAGPAVAADRVILFHRVGRREVVEALASRNRRHRLALRLPDQLPRRLRVRRRTAVGAGRRRRAGVHVRRAGPAPRRRSRDRRRRLAGGHPRPLRRAQGVLRGGRGLLSSRTDRSSRTSAAAAAASSRSTPPPATSGGPRRPTRRAIRRRSAPPSGGGATPSSSPVPGSSGSIRHRARFGSRNGGAPASGHR